MKILLVALAVALPNLGWAGGSTTVGPGNPAAGTCEGLGGKWSILEDEGLNQWGFCAFDRALISDWTLFRHRGGERQQAVQAFLRRPINLLNQTPNPAYGFCTNLGGTIRNWNGSLGYPTNGPVLLCQFPDRSIIGAWTLFYGPADSGNQLLASLLTCHP